MASAGYAFLRDHLALSAFPALRPATIAPVQRILETPMGLQVPSSVAPKTNDPLDHILFALKHEGTNLQVLAEAMSHVPALELIERFRRAPSSLLVRKACFLYEAFVRSLEDVPSVAGPYGDLFNPEHYLTGPAQKNSKWRINFNGIGSLDYCPTVERTDVIGQGMANDTLGRAKAFFAEIGPINTDRALAWAYLSETEHSFAIERESADHNKAATFVALLQQAHAAQDLTEDYLADLQSATISNPFDKAASFRHQQNWLRGGSLRGASSISYVPPSPELLAQLMPRFMDLANTAPAYLDPIVAASISSFGFVFLHPFMDGNGRLSRFLFHHGLCRSGQLSNGLLLPVSVAMKHDEHGYLETLQSFSKPARALWSAHWLDDEHFDFRFNGQDSIYRYWDATPCVEYGLKMAERSLDIYLRQEVEYLARFDRIYKLVNDEYDIRNNDLHLLIVSAIQHNGLISKNRRKQLAYQVPAEAFTFIEEIVKQELQDVATPSQSL